MPSLSQILKSKIGKGGKSKTYIANELKVSEKTVENYMHGKRQPKPHALKRLAEMLDFSLDDLSNGEDAEQNVPRGRSTEQAETENGIADPKKRETVIADLAHGNRIQSDTTNIVAQTNQKLVDQSIELTKALTGNSPSNIQLVDISRLMALQEVLAELAFRSGMYPSKDLAAREIGISLKLHVGDKGSLAGTVAGEGRKSTAM